MLQYFKKVRKNMLSNHKMFTYLKYPFGEIILVVIGILIALQFNNFNEQRKKKNEIEDLITVFKTELSDNIILSDRLVNIGNIKDSILSLYFTKKLTRNDLIANGLLGLGFNTHTQPFVDENLLSLLSLEKELPANYKHLVPELKELKRLINSQRYWEKKCLEISMNTIQELASTLDWFYESDSISTNKRVDYVLNDPLYRNKLIYYNGYDLTENIWDASLIRTTAISILWELDKENYSSIHDFLSQFDLKSFIKYTCVQDRMVFENPELVRINYIMYNATETPIQFYIMDSSGNREYSEIQTLAPHSFLLGENSMNYTNHIQIIKDGECKMNYYKLYNDYLVVED